MIVVLAVARPDFHLALKWLKWAARMAPKAKPYRLLVWGTKALDGNQWAQIHTAAEGLDVLLQDTPEPFEQGYAPSANYLFRTALEFCERMFPHEPILWCEADTVPLRPSWGEEIEAEYAACGKPFLGDMVEYRMGLAGAVNHLTGNSVYPPNWRELAPAIAALPGPDPMIGWDSSCAYQIVPQAARSKTIQQIWRPPFITDAWAAAHIRPTTALFHQCKDGSLIDVLCARAGEAAIPLSVPLCPSTYPAHIAQMNPERVFQQPRVSILIVTYAKDMDFLRYCLASIRKYAFGFSEVVVVVPEHERGLYDWIKKGVRVGYFAETPGKGMMSAQIQKLRADEWCPNAEYVLHLDADNMMFRRCVPSDFVIRGQALMVREAYSTIKNPNRHIWKDCVKKAIGIEPSHDTMVRHPQIHPAAVYAATREAVEKHTGQAFNDYVLSCRNDFPQGFCEWITAGTIGIEQMPGEYHFVEYDHAADAALVGHPPGSFQYLYKRGTDFIVEWWSWGGIGRYKSDCDAILGGRLAEYWIK